MSRQWKLSTWCRKWPNVKDDLILSTVKSMINEYLFAVKSLWKPMMIYQQCEEPHSIAIISKNQQIIFGHLWKEVLDWGKSYVNFACFFGFIQRILHSTSIETNAVLIDEYYTFATVAWVISVHSRIFNALETIWMNKCPFRIYLWMISRQGQVIAFHSSRRM